MTAVPQSSRWRKTLLRALGALAILTPCFLGFGNKFLELIDVYQVDAEGAFAIAPIMNYLLASLGFLLLFGWAAANGMFRNIEQPKQAMLENEARLEGQVYSPVSSRDEIPSMDELDLRTPEAEGHFHRYTSNRIPWYVRLLWVGFWCYTVYYTIQYLFPDLQAELQRRSY